MYKGYVFAHRFTYEPNRPYPETSSVEFWLNGLGEFVAWGKINTSPEDPDQTPYVFESEVLSPFADLQPGEQTTYHYDWYTARIPRDCEVVACNDIGVVCEPLSTRIDHGTTLLNGRFGVFHRGVVRVVVLDAQGRILAIDEDKISVSPLDAFELRDYTLTCDKVGTQAATATIQLVMYSEEGQRIGKLTDTAR